MIGVGRRGCMALQIRLEALEDRDGLARTDLDHGLLPGTGPAGGHAAALGLARHLRRADLEHMHVEERLDGLLDLRLVRLVMHPERVLLGRRQHVGLLRDDGPDDHLAVFHQASASLRSSAALTSSRPRLSFCARAVRLSSAACETTSVAARTRSATPTSSTCRTTTRARLRKDLAAVSSSSASATSTLPPRWACSRLEALAVLGASNALASSTWIVERSAWMDSAQRSAARRALRLTLTTYLRGLGPKTVPPPVQMGEREVPARARPVPFWRQGLAPPPDTIPRVLVAWVPWRRAASSAT